MVNKKQNRNISKQEALVKASSFCAYQERTQEEVREKLKRLDVDEDLIEETVTEMIRLNFLNEERYCRSYAGGKFRLKKWGRLKIIRALESKGLTKRNIALGIKEIDEKEYQATLKHLIDKKKAEIKTNNIYGFNHKLSQYLIGKGYEPELVWELIRDRGE